jgi:hypothetical protein
MQTKQTAEPRRGEGPQTSKASKGKVVRLSLAAFEQLALRRKAGGFRSWDALLRHLFGLPARKGPTPPLRILREYWIVDDEAIELPESPIAKGKMFEYIAAKSERLSIKPVRVREVL